MRALLIVNPHATSTTQPRRDLIVRALGSAVDLEVVETRYRGEATRLAAGAAASKTGLVITLGGDGTVNEAVNGLRSAADADDIPASRPARARGPARRQRQRLRPVAATAGRSGRRGGAADRGPGRGPGAAIGLGTANGRYFTFNAGLGLDAEVVRAAEGRRAHGRALTPARYARTALRQFFRVTDRRHPAITIAAPEDLCAEPVFLCIVSNSAPWTYLGDRPVHTNPDASFDTGLDLFALRSLGATGTLLDAPADAVGPGRAAARPRRPDRA